ncbi:MAG: hypothetical protein QM737_21045 [Ferruginibacter sp.]
MLKITIPKPCHENWDNMTPNQQGRHCSSCEKTVVDFTQMTEDEVKYFFINKRSERVCGRFSSAQLHHISIELPQNIFQLQLPLWKQFLVASLLVFSTTLFSCDVNTNGKVEIAAQTNHVLNPVNLPVLDTIPIDTNARKENWIGQARVRPVQCVKKGEATVKPLMGDTVIVEQPKPDREFLGEVDVVEKPDTIVTKPTDPMIMGKIMIAPKKPSGK